MAILRGVFGVVAGYAVMVVLITLVQETWFGGVDFYESSKVELGVAGLFTCLSAVVGGAVGTAVAGVTTRLVAWILSAFVSVETTTLIVSGEAGGPLWFDIMAGGSLIVGIFAGVILFLRWKETSGARPSVPQPDGA